MTDLGGGVFLEKDDPWEDTGYVPHENGPAPAPAPDDGMPKCPFCDATTGHLRIASPPGIICGGCGNHFTSAPGEYAAMKNRRDIWREETRGSSRRGGVMAMAATVLEVYVLDRRTGVWCDPCALPSVVENDAALVHPTTLKVLASSTVWLCTGCGSNGARPHEAPS